MNDRQRESTRSSHYMQGFYPGILEMGLNDLRSLRSLVTRLPEFLSEEQSKFQRQLENHVNNEQMDEEQASSFYDYHEEEFHELHTFFPNAVWISQLTLACSLFEARLMEACKFLENSRIPIKQAWATIKIQAVLKKSAVFLRKNFCIFPERHKSWSTIGDFFQMRNCFVHANGEVDLTTNPTNTVECATRLSHAGITLSDTRALRLEAKSITAAVDEMEAWLKAFQVASMNDTVIGPMFWP